jgi:FAR1 DNA-binding domain
LPRKKQGSFDYDREKGGFVHEWTSLAEFDAWRRQEELTNSIELLVSKTRSGKEYKEKRVYVCSREPTGGEKPYPKKHPERIRKRESKKTGCRCQITIKIYYDTSTVLGKYDADHDHEVGAENVACMWMSHAARNKIYQMLTQQMDPKEIVCNTILIFLIFFNNKSDQFV